MLPLSKKNLTILSEVKDTAYSLAILLLGSYSRETSTYPQRHAQGCSLAAVCNSKIAVHKYRRLKNGAQRYQVLISGTRECDFIWKKGLC